MRRILLFLSASAAFTAASNAVPAAPAPPAATPAFQEHAFGPLILRVDPRYWSLSGSRPGLVELSGRSADGTARWRLADDGVVLLGEFEAPSCMIVAHENQYADLERGLIALYQSLVFRKEAEARPQCPAASHLEEMKAALRYRTAALAAMKDRARELFGRDPSRCVTPERPAGSTPPHHPPCGFPPPWIGEPDDKSSR
jgi:hypothetical protein